MSEVQVQTAPTELRHLQPDAALAITRSLHSDLDLSGIVKRLYTFACGLTRLEHLCYANSNPDVRFEHGRECEHQLTYELKLTSQVESAGNITLSGSTPITSSDQEMVEELLSLGASALRNAHRHHGMAETATEAVQSQTRPRDDKYPDALVLIRIDGLEQLRHTQQGDELAEKLMTELKVRLGDALRGADGTMQVDQDHLAVLLPCTATLGANRVAEKVSLLMGSLESIDPAVLGNLAISFGISSTREAGSAEAVLANAKVQLSKTTSLLPPDQVVH